MSNKKKIVPINVLHLLKSVMDKKAGDLTVDVLAGKRAVEERKVLQEHIVALHQFVSNCRTFDPSERREAEEDLADKEEQLQGIEKRIARGKDAEQQLIVARQFDSTYVEICTKYNKAIRIRELEGIAQELETKIDVLQNKIEMCHMGIDLSCRTTNQATQAVADANKYIEQYQDLEALLIKTNRQLKQLQK